METSTIEIVLVSIVWLVSITAWLVRLNMRLTFLEKSQSVCQKKREGLEIDITELIHSLDKKIEVLKTNSEWIRREIQKGKANGGPKD